MSRVLCLVIAFASFGCQSSPSVPYDETLPDPPMVRAGEFEYFVDPYLDEDRVRDAFGADCAEIGLLPVRLGIVNHHGGPLILDAESIALVSADEVRASTDSVGDVGIDEGSARVRGILQSGVVGFFLGPLMEAGFARVEATQADARMARVALRSRTLDPGDRTSGFVYFFFGEQQTVPRADWAVRLELSAPGEGQPTTVLLPLTSNP